MDVVIDRSLSFSIDGEMPPGIVNICLYSEKKKKYYIHAPKIDQLKKILEPIGINLVVTESGKQSYDKLKKVSIDRVQRQVKQGKKVMAKFFYAITFPSYPSNPKFIHGVNYWRWANVARKVSEKGAQAAYDVEHPYALVEVMDWLRNEGFDVTASNAVLESLAKPLPTFVTISSMEINPDLVMKEYQLEDVAEITRMGYKGIIGTSPGLGKTIISGKIILDLFDASKIKRVIWVVPTTPLVSQVLDEMKSRFGLDGTGVTADLVDRKERLGIDENGQKTGQSIYERSGFIVVTWATYVMDWTGETFEKITKYIWFDLGIFDEAHRAKAGKTTFSAILNCICPYRILLSGTIMPNGKWEELQDMVSAITPTSVMLKWFLSSQEDKLADDLAADPEIERPRQEARIRITGRALPMLLKHVTRHRTEDVAAGVLPAMTEASIGIHANQDEDSIISLLIGMLSAIIEEWQSSAYMFHGTKKQQEQYMTMKSAKDLAWQVTRWYCSHGAFTFQKWIDELDAKDAPVHVYIKSKFKAELAEIKRLLAKGTIRIQPKNNKVLLAINKLKARRCLVFYDSVDGAVMLARYLKDEGKNVRVVVGRSISTQDASELGQAKTMRDVDIASTLEWYWFPWWTISRLSSIKGVRVTYIASDGERRNRLYYVDAHEIGNSFFVEMEMTSTGDPRVEAIEQLVNVFAGISIPSVTITHDLDPRSDVTIFTASITIDPAERDDRVLVCTEKMKEGANLQNTDLLIFYDQPMSIRQREQRIGRVKRMQCTWDAITLVSISLGLDHAIKKTLAFKYQAASNIGYEDPEGEVSMLDIMKSIGKHDDVMKGPKETSLFDFEDDQEA